jgi:hypothetical protein
VLAWWQGRRLVRPSRSYATASPYQSKGLAAKEPRGRRACRVPMRRAARSRPATGDTSEAAPANRASTGRAKPSALADGTLPKSFGAALIQLMGREFLNMRTKFVKYDNK